MKNLITNNKSILPVIAIFLVALIISSVPCMAQEKEISTIKAPKPVLLAEGDGKKSDSPGKWKYNFTLATFMPVMDSNLSIGDRNTQTVVSPSQVIDKIDSAFNGRFEANNGKWGAFMGLFYIKLKDDLNFRRISGNTRMEMTIWQTAVTYRISEGDTKVDALAGFRYQAIDMDINLSPLARVSKRADWMDPIIGARANFPLSKNMDFNLYGDVGGFGMGSKFTWRTDAIFNWHLSEGFALNGGYILLDTDYRKGTGLGEFKYDTTLKGPVFGATFKF